MKKSETDVVPFARGSISPVFMKIITKSIHDHSLEKGEFREIALGHSISFEPCWNDQRPLFKIKFESMDMIYLYREI